MNKIYGLRNDKENTSLIIADDKATLIIQTAESYEVRELNLEFDLENENKISADKVKPINISTNKITGGTIDGNNILIDALQTNILAGKLDYLETKLKEKDEEISKLKDLTNTKVSSEEFWNFVKYYTEESDTLLEVEPIDIAEYYKDESNKVFRTYESNSEEEQVYLSVDGERAFLTTFTKDKVTYTSAKLEKENVYKNDAPEHEYTIFIGDYIANVDFGGNAIYALRRTDKNF